MTNRKLETTAGALMYIDAGPFYKSSLEFHPTGFHATYALIWWDTHSHSSTNTGTIKSFKEVDVFRKQFLNVTKNSYSSLKYHLPNNKHL